MLATIVILRMSLGSPSSDKFNEKRIRYLNTDEEKEKRLDDDVILSHHNSDSDIQKKVRKTFSASFNDYKGRTFVFFHLGMSLFAIYLVMLFFDWKELNIDFNQWSELTARSVSGFIIKTFNVVVLLVLYIWTLVAPAVLTERNFETE